MQQQIDMSNAAIEDQIQHLKAQLQVKHHSHVQQTDSSFLPSTLSGMLTFESNAAAMRKTTLSPTSITPTPTPTALPSSPPTVNTHKGGYKSDAYSEHEARVSHARDEYLEVQAEENVLAHREGLTKEQKAAELRGYLIAADMKKNAIQEAEALATKLNPVPLRPKYCTREEAVLCDPQSSRCAVHPLSLHLYCRCLMGYIPGEYL
jgi:hypothetical protein